MNVIDDYWNMAQFDCLIRAASNFSRSAQLLGDHKIILFPKHAGWIDDKNIVDVVGIALYNKQARNIITETYKPLQMTLEERKNMRRQLQELATFLKKK
jgi:hypothetical protein